MRPSLQRIRAGRSTIGAIGCPMQHLCPCRQQPPGGQLGFMLQPQPSVDFSNWQTWAIAGLAAVVLYQLLFSSEKRKKRAVRRAQLSAARHRYLEQVRRIKEAA